MNEPNPSQPPAGRREASPYEGPETAAPMETGKKPRALFSLFVDGLLVLTASFFVFIYLAGHFVEVMQTHPGAFGYGYFVGSLILPVTALVFLRTVKGCSVRALSFVIIAFVFFLFLMEVVKNVQEQAQAAVGREKGEIEQVYVLNRAYQTVVPDGWRQDASIRPSADVTMVDHQLGAACSISGQARSDLPAGLTLEQHVERLRKAFVEDEVETSVSEVDARQVGGMPALGFRATEKTTEHTITYWVVVVETPDYFIEFFMWAEMDIFVMVEERFKNILHYFERTPDSP
ncbi:hypothetical protein [Acanthopleuribacter pedis]|uniref:Transmembrane protein n=1 Tax=Acanthopleuribacter pedis TaxID=442870 RepID=A0A8J7U413_9BACT|nr:hypothetical protein [Acanthopleuribacter pedis]MBO1319334.1 hypothetical protein [Acanthopleuribacter pedis]